MSKYDDTRRMESRKVGETRLLEEDSEWYHVAMDIADLINNYRKGFDDPRDYSARAIFWCLEHIEREAEAQANENS